MTKYRIKIAGEWASGLFYKVEWHSEARRGFLSEHTGAYWRSGIVQEYEEVVDDKES